MAEPFLGEIRVFAFGKIPREWLPCDGRELEIQKYAALFSLLGTAFGGDGTKTFKIPDLRGRTPVCMSFQSSATYRQGDMGGVEKVVLTGAQVPAHSHSVNVYKEEGGVIALADNLLAKNKSTAAATAFNVYAPYDSTKAVALNAATIQTAGGNQGHENRQPSLAVQYCIAAVGFYPSRP